MFYRLQRKRQIRQYNEAISGILDTPPLRLEDAPWGIVSMVAKGDVTMYLLALKSFYRKLGRGRVIAIIDRDTPEPSLDLLKCHVPEIEFVILEDIPTGECQRGGTWERLLYCLDRSETEYTIQLDADTLTVGADIDEVVRCVNSNTPFTMSDGFALMPLPEIADEADITPSDYIGIVTERRFRDYPDAANWRYVRGSSGFAGFSRGGFGRAEITRFHVEMEKLVGAKRWREWGTEQSGSNFAIANSPGAVILPFPEYESFIPNALRKPAKFFHFIGASRFIDDYYAARGQEVIAELLPGRAPSLPVREKPPVVDSYPLAFARSLTPRSAASYLAWRLAGKRGPIWVKSRVGPEYQLRPPTAGNNDGGVAYEMFVYKLLQPIVWIPRVRVKLVVDIGANVGMSLVYLLGMYWRANAIAFEPHPGHVAQCRANLARNGYDTRTTLYEAAAGAADGSGWISDDGSSSHMSNVAGSGFETKIVDIFPILAEREIDVMKIDIEGGEYELLEDPRFETLNVRAIVLEWHARPDRPDGHAWCRDRLTALGYRLYPIFENKNYGMFWAYRTDPLATADSQRWRRATEDAEVAA